MQTRDSVASPPATLADLLDRVLDRGLLINADIVICLAGVPLIGINLRAALAGIETMVEYGLMLEWDRAIRASSAGVLERPVISAAEKVTSMPGHQLLARPEDQ